MTLSRLTNAMPLASSLIATNWVLSQSNNISYGTRGVVRVNKTPDDRKGDYFFRDFFMVWVCGFIMEGSFRALDKFYYSPLMTQALKLHQLSQLPHPYRKEAESGKQLSLYPGAKSYKALPESFRMRAMGSLVRSSSRSLVPQVLMENALADLRKTEKGFALQKMERLIQQPDADPAFLTHILRTKYKEQYGREIPDHELRSLEKSITAIAHTDNPAQWQKQLKSFLKRYSSTVQNRLSAQSIQHAARMEESRQTGILLDHLYRTLDFKGYLQKMLVPRGELSSQEADHIWHAIEANFQKDAKTTEEQAPVISSEMEKKLLQGLPNINKSQQEKILGYIREGLTSQARRSHFAQIQKSGTWPKIISVVGLNFIAYGWLATQFDNKKLQPYQSKIVDRHDTSQPLATAGFIGFLPALGLFVAGMWNRMAPSFIRRMDHFNRFIVVGSASLIAFATIWYKALQTLLDRKNHT